VAPSHRLRYALLSGTLVLGAGLASVGVAAAASGPSTTSTPATSTSTPCPPHVGDPTSAPNGPRETPLSGSDLAKASAAAQAAVPGATVLRAEADPSGSFEIHMKKSDGTHVTVTLNANFAETAIETGFGPGPHGPGPMGPRGDRPTDAPMGPQGPMGAMTR
jgi:hypothetical protein